MPDITLLGWFHTVLGIASILLGFFSLFSFKFLSWNKIPSRIYLVLTFITALSALGIYNQGRFGIAHVMGVLAVLAVLCGYMLRELEYWAIYQRTFILYALLQLFYSTVYLQQQTL